jgi:hypothetical protein
MGRRIPLHTSVYGNAFCHPFTPGAAVRSSSRATSSSGFNGCSMRSQSSTMTSKRSRRLSERDLPSQECWNQYRSQSRPATFDHPPPLSLTAGICTISTPVVLMTSWTRHSLLRSSLQQVGTSLGSPTSRPSVLKGMHDVRLLQGTGRRRPGRSTTRSIRMGLTASVSTSSRR